MHKIIATALALLLAFNACATGLFDIVTKGSVDRSVTVDIIDSADGTPENGVVFNTSGIDLWYRREGAASVDVTEVTLAALTTAHADGGFLLVNDGTYRLDLPDAAFATGANYVDFGGTVTGMIVIGGRVRLVDYNLEVNWSTNAAAGASGGLLISGTNAGTTTLGALTVTGATTHTGATIYTGAVSMAAGLAITQSASNTAGLSVTGNGTGNGATFTSGSGATGNGISATAASTNGNGLAVTGTGTGSGLIGTAGATGDGLEGIGGATSGAGLRTAGTAGNSPAATFVGQGSAAGLLSTGGATGHGISAVGGATSGSGISAVASTSGSGVVATGVGTTQPGIVATGGSTSSAGISATGGGTGSGVLATGGATGHGMRLVGGATSGNGISTAFTAPSSGAPEFGFNVSGTLSGTHSSTTADLGANAPSTVSDLVGHTLEFPTRHLSRPITSYDTATGIATFETIDADITLTNGDPWLLYATAPGSGGGSGATAAEVWGYSDRQLTALDEDTTTLDLNATTVGTVTTATNVTTVNGLAANVITAAATASDFSTEVQSGLATASALTTLSNTVGVAGAGLTATDDAVITLIGAAGAGLTAVDDAIMTRVGAPVGASISADIAAVESGISWNSSWDAEIESEANDALVANHLDHLLAADYDPTSKPGVATALLNELVESDAGVSRYSANALEQAPTGSGASVSAIADEVQTRTIAAVTTVNGLAANAITAAATASDFTTEVTSGLASASALSTLSTTVGVAGAGLTAVDDAVLSAIAALNNLSAADVGNLVIEDQGGGVSLRCAIAVALAYAAGDLATSANTPIYEDPSGTETRITGTISSSGNRAMSITCPTY